MDIKDIAAFMDKQIIRHTDNPIIEKLGIREKWMNWRYKILRKGWEPINTAPFGIDILIKMLNGRVTVAYRQPTGEFLPAGISGKGTSFESNPVRWRRIPEEWNSEW